MADAPSPSASVSRGRVVNDARVVGSASEETMGREVRRVVLVAPELAPRAGGMATTARTLAAASKRGDRGARVRREALRARGRRPPREHRAAALRAGIDLWGDLLITLDALLVDAPTSSTSATPVSRPGSLRSPRPPRRPSPSRCTATI